jgi:hypothetical protein
MIFGGFFQHELYIYVDKNAGGGREGGGLER